jgi:hypothetical protein
MKLKAEHVELLQVLAGLALHGELTYEHLRNRLKPLPSKYDLAAEKRNIALRLACASELDGVRLRDEAEFSDNSSAGRLISQLDEEGLLIQIKERRRTFTLSRKGLAEYDGGRPVVENPRGKAALLRPDMSPEVGDVRWSLEYKRKDGKS